MQNSLTKRNVLQDIWPNHVDNHRECNKNKFYIIDHISKLVCQHKSEDYRGGDKSCLAHLKFNDVVKKNVHVFFEFSTVLYIKTNPHVAIYCKNLLTYQTLVIIHTFNSKHMSIEC